MVVSENHGSLISDIDSPLQFFANVLWEIFPRQTHQTEMEIGLFNLQRDVGIEPLGSGIEGSCELNVLLFEAQLNFGMIGNHHGTNIELMGCNGRNDKNGAVGESDGTSATQRISG